MKKFLIFAFAVLLFASCNKEIVKLRGTVKGVSSAKMDFKIKSMSGEEIILNSEVEVDNESFSATINNAKPPYMLTLSLNKSKEYNFWIFKYGKLTIELDTSSTKPISVLDCFQNAEYDRIRENYDEMYIEPLKGKIRWVEENKDNQHLTDEELIQISDYNKKIKTGYKLYKKSVLSTFRKNKSNVIATALMYDVFNKLTSWQKEEYLKNINKYLSDCGINWQLKN